MADPTPPDQPASRRPQRPRDLVISLLVLLVPVVGLIGGYQLISGRTEPVAVDPAPALAEARAAGFPVTEPPALRAEWVPVSATFQASSDGATLRLGYVSPEGGSVQLVESTVPSEVFLAEQLGEVVRPAGTGQVPETVAGESWQRFATRPDELALVRLRSERTTVVVGTAAEPELRELAAATH